MAATKPPFLQKHDFCIVFCLHVVAFASLTNPVYVNVSPSVRLYQGRESHSKFVIIPGPNLGHLLTPVVTNNLNLYL